MSNGLICDYITGIHNKSIANHAPHDICRKQSEFSDYYLVPYTRNFSRYVNFTDFAVSRATVTIYSVKILLSHYLRVRSIEFVVLMGV